LPDAICEEVFQRIHLAYNLLEIIARLAKLSAYCEQQLALDKAPGAQYGSRVKETFDDLMKRIAATQLLEGLGTSVRNL
jgi:hypothetical protein